MCCRSQPIKTVVLPFSAMALAVTAVLCKHAEEPVARRVLLASLPAALREIRSISKDKVSTGLLLI